MSEEKKTMSKHNVLLAKDTFEKITALQEKFKQLYGKRYTKDDVVWALIEYFKQNLNEDELLKFKKLLDEAKARMGEKEKKEVDLKKLIEELKSL